MYLLPLLMTVAAAKRSSARCKEADITQLGGTGAVIMNNLSRCLPDVISEANMAVVEGCLLLTFSPENLSDGCKRCANEFFRTAELELKQCLIRCTGLGGSNTCSKCKDSIADSWDTTCFAPPVPVSNSTQRVKNAAIGTSVSNGLSVILMCVVLLWSNFV